MRSPTLSIEWELNKSRCQADSRYEGYQHYDMFVEVRYQEGNIDNIFTARLSEINPIDVDEKTSQALTKYFYLV